MTCRIDAGCPCRGAPRDLPSACDDEREAPRSLAPADSAHGPCHECAFSFS